MEHGQAALSVVGIPKFLMLKLVLNPIEDKQYRRGPQHGFVTKVTNVVRSEHTFRLVPAFYTSRTPHHDRHILYTLHPMPVRTRC